MNRGLTNTVVFVATIAFGALVALSFTGNRGSSSGLSTKTLVDPSGDAVIRRTDPGADGPINPLSALPDVVELRLSGWAPFNPATDPYAGTTVQGNNAEIVRVDVVFAGLVNPPGTLGLGATTFDPFKFGQSPVFGFVELDVDSRKDSGGEIGGAAEQRYLANVGRFGGVPYGSIGENAARSGLGGDFDLNFYTVPAFERSGQDFSIVMCGCDPITLISQTGNMNGVFDAGETMIVQSRFFQRAGGYTLASSMFGGSNLGTYDPITRLRFSHSVQTNTTTMSLVFALTMEGAAQLAGESVQSIDLIVDSLGSHASLLEAVVDLIAAADGDYGPIFDLPTAILIDRWEGRNPDDTLDPTEWDATVLVGTTYTNDSESLYVWTDVGCNETSGDFDGDGLIGALDEASFNMALSAMDGTTQDADGIVNSRVVLQNFGPNFSLFDVNGDGILDGIDIGQSMTCAADWNGDQSVNSTDYFDFLMSFFASAADFNNDGTTNSNDYFEFLAAFFDGCQ